MNRSLSTEEDVSSFYSFLWSIFSNLNFKLGISSLSVLFAKTSGEMIDTGTPVA